MLSGIYIRALNGRAEIEKSIKDLQAAERQGVLKERNAFLFDLDRKPSGIEGSALVRVEQLHKYCIENYLLDEIALYDLVQQYATRKPESRGQFARDLKAVALKQLDDVILQELLKPYRSIRIGLKGSETKAQSLSEVANRQRAQIKTEFEKLQLAISDPNWVGNFQKEHSTKREEELPLWENEWKKLCSGKVLLEQLKASYQINLDTARFKALLAERLAREGKDDITALRDLIERLMN